VTRYVFTAGDLHSTHPAGFARRCLPRFPDGIQDYIAIGSLLAGGGEIGLTIDGFNALVSASRGDKVEAAASFVVIPIAGTLNRFAIREAKTLEGPNRGMIRVFEAQGDISRDYVKYEAGMAGACSDLATRKRIVPALRFDNPKENGLNFVRFDGLDPNDPMVLTDRKTALTTFPKQQAAIERAADALRQNPGYSAVFEFPTEEAANRANSILARLNVLGSISVRVSP